ncbi:hypothetical protein [Sorangium sp. So ce406]|uniref:hypothetical protein n=1 Tax=Sorangium sp. So ce406 TaxID=3133311 RepID=UPI003F5BD9C9
MAIWQCSFLIVPSTERGRDSRSLSQRIERGTFWSDSQPGEDIERAALDILGKGASWSSDVDVWGDEDSTCLLMVRDGNRIVEVLLRVDLRSIQKQDLARLLDGFQRARVLLVDETAQLYEPTLFAVLQALQASTAWKYVTDPVTFIASLSEEDNRN